MKEEKSIQNKFDEDLIRIKSIPDKLFFIVRNHNGFPILDATVSLNQKLFFTNRKTGIYELDWPEPNMYDIYINDYLDLDNKNVLIMKQQIKEELISNYVIKEN